MAETWDESKPAGSRSPTLGDDDAREFKRAIRERLAEDHIFKATENPAFGAAGGYDIGKHKFLTLVQRNTSKVTASDEVAFVCKSVSGSPELLLTPPSAGTDRQITKNAGANFNLNSGDFGSLIIPAGSLMADAVNSSNIADDSVLAAHIAADQVNSSHIADYAVNAAQLNSSAVETAKLADDLVTPAKSSHGFVPVLRITPDVIEYSADNWNAAVSIPIKLPSGPTAINGQVRIRSGANTWAYVRLHMSGQYSGQAARQNENYAWLALASSMDISGLTPGTVYTLEIQGNGSDVGVARIDGISLWWE